jgi:hypothetical protein
LTPPRTGIKIGAVDTMNAEMDALLDRLERARELAQIDRDLYAQDDYDFDADL